MTQQNEAFCAICGAEITEENGVADCAVCVECQTHTFKKLEEVNGTHLAIFLTCAAYNIPCEPTIVPTELANAKGNKWEQYLQLLVDNDKLYKGDQQRTFFNGVSDIRMIFGKALSQTDFAKFVEWEQKRVEKLQGTAEQREMWGIEEDFTVEVYNELDRQYANRVAAYQGVTLTAQMQDTLQKVCLWNWRIEQYIKAGKIKEAKALQSMVETALASEQMRKKDEKPVEDLKLDSIVVALNKAGIMRNGHLLTFDELVEVLRDKAHEKSRYAYSLDVADQILLDITNTMRANADQVLLTELPEEMELEDYYGEFAPEETEQEKINKRYAGLTKVQFVKKPKPESEE